MFIRSVTVACLFAFAALAQVPCKWDAEASQASPASFSCYRGETLVFQPTFLEYGVTSTNATYTMQWQTNGMGTAYWSTNILQFTPAMDVGASAYTIFIRAAMINGVSYRANAKIKMLGAPGLNPNIIALPVQYIDFDVTPYSNAPWLLSSAWLTWLSTNTYIKVESDPGIPAALVIASTNAQALASAAQANAIAFASTNLTTRLFNPMNTAEFIDGSGSRYVISNFWEMTFSEGFAAGYNIAPLYTNYLFTVLDQYFYERASEFAPYWRISLTGVKYLPGGFYEWEWQPTTNNYVMDPVIGGATGQAYIRQYSTTNLVGILAMISDMPAPSAGLPEVWTNMTWGAAGTNATYRMYWDITNGTFAVEEIIP